MIWLFNGDPLQNGAEAVISGAALAGGVFVSPVSAWEIGLLSRPRGGQTLHFLPDPTTWFARAMARPGLLSAPFTPEIAIAASHLPEPLHGDPADRMLIATARALGMPIGTRDAKIVAYGAAGHVAVGNC